MHVKESLSRTFNLKNKIRNLNFKNIVLSSIDSNREIKLWTYLQKYFSTLEEKADRKNVFQIIEMKG